MIKIKRPQCPQLLKMQRKNCNDYNKTKVVKALWKMQKKKCCYCESLIPEAGHMKAVEHFRPKSIFRNLTNHWPNLLLSCSQCNGKKSDKFPMKLCNKNGQNSVIWLKKDSKNRSLINKFGKLLLINPSDPNVNPENELDYILDDTEVYFGQIIHKTELGEATIKVIELNSVLYISKRRDCYRRKLYPALLNLCEAMDREDINEIRIKKATFEALLNSESELAGFARSFARYKKMDKRYKITIPT
ncbi:MAG TPA: HNH endonuclease [Ignavibacteriaceae bacterium]|nr:HNH endonuclease [Ignavibacteriaceae bacterium]